MKGPPTIEDHQAAMRQYTETGTVPLEYMNRVLGTHADASMGIGPLAGPLTVDELALLDRQLRAIAIYRGLG